MCIRDSINTTYKVYFFRGGEIKDYILQRVNTYVFKDPVGMMHNITSCLLYTSRRRLPGDLQKSLALRPFRRRPRVQKGKRTGEMLYRIYPGGEGLRTRRGRRIYVYRLHVGGRTV